MGHAARHGLLYMAMIADPDRRWTILLFFTLGGLAVLNRPTLGVFMLPFSLRHPRFFLRLDHFPLKLLLVLLLFATDRVLGTPESCSYRSLPTHIGHGPDDLDGTAGGDRGWGYQADGTTYLHLLSIPERHRMFTPDPAERSELFRNKWKAERLAEPGLAWRMFAMKLKNFWLSRSAIGQDHVVGMPWAMALYRVHATVLFGLLIVSQFFADRRFHYIGLSVLLLSLAQCAYYFETRHRLLVDPILISLALVVIARIGERIPRRERMIG
ncbi:MAG: hypothetical protein R2811_01860 [Flavobacteriales bacterium]